MANPLNNEGQAIRSCLHPKELACKIKRMAKAEAEDKFINTAYVIVNVAALALLTVGSVALAGHIPSIGNYGGISMIGGGLLLFFSWCCLLGPLYGMHVDMSIHNRRLMCEPGYADDFYYG